jgi:uncharacterized membrane protein
MILFLIRNYFFIMYLHSSSVSSSLFGAWSINTKASAENHYKKLFSYQSLSIQEAGLSKWPIEQGPFQRAL